MRRRVVTHARRDEKVRRAGSRRAGAGGGCAAGASGRDRANPKRVRSYSDAGLIHKYAPAALRTQKSVKYLITFCKADAA
jgi:hypothetical protein